jgi:chitodextrinase
MERVAALERRPTMRYVGTWDADKTYTEGDFVTSSGSLWAASADSRGCRPGAQNAGLWKLAAKRGADGKDRRP